MCSIMKKNIFYSTFFNYYLDFEMLKSSPPQTKLPNAGPYNFVMGTHMTSRKVYRW